MARALIKLSPNPKRGEVIEIKTLISHEMETGFRHTNTGTAIPRDIITTLCRHLQRRGDFLRPAVSGDRRQSLHYLLHDRQRERHA